MGEKRTQSMKGGDSPISSPLPTPSTPNHPLTMSRIEQLQAFSREDPDDPFVRFALAQEHLKHGDSSAALGYFEGLAADHPDYVGTYYHLGKLYETLDRPDDALRTYRTGIAEAGRAADAHARAELQSALLEAQGLGFDDD